MGNLKTLKKSSHSLAILGANGFIGSAISKKLISNGWKVENNEVLDLSDYTSWENNDFIINCVGTTNPNEEIAFRVNAEFPAKLAKFAAKTGAKLIHFGSSAEYASSKNLISEKSATKTEDIYSKSKLEGTNAILEFGKIGRSTVLRPFGIIQRVSDPIPAKPSKLLKIISEASSQQKVEVKNPEAIRDLVGIDDLALITVKLLDSDREWPSIANISSGVGHSLREIVIAVNPHVEIVSKSQDVDDIYVGDPRLIEEFLDFRIEKNFRNVLFPLTSGSN